MKKVLFVCTGNTCRSPMSKALFEKLLKDKGIDNISVDSAGLSAVDGDGISANATEVLKEEGIELSYHKAKRLSAEMVNNADLIVALSPSHRGIISACCPNHVGKTVVLGDGILDPYGGNIDIYRECRNEIKKALPAVLVRVDMNE